jgi:hypothetical protein
MSKIKTKNGKRIWTSHDNFPDECEHNTKPEIFKDYKEEGLEFGWQYCPKCGLQRFKIEEKKLEPRQEKLL